MLTFLSSIFHPLLDILQVFYLFKLDLLLFEVQFLLSRLLVVHLVGKKLPRTPQILIDLMHGLRGEVAAKRLSCLVYVGPESAVLEELHLFFLCDHVLEHFETPPVAHLLIIELLEHICLSIR